MRAYSGLMSSGFASVSPPSINDDPSDSKPKTSSSRSTPSDLGDLTGSQATPHDLLRLRLQPFWSTPIAAARIQISVYRDKGERDAPSESGNESLSSTYQSLETPLYTTTTSTDSQGLFKSDITFPWEALQCSSDLVTSESSVQNSLSIVATTTLLNEIYPTETPTSPVYSMSSKEPTGREGARINSKAIIAGAQDKPVHSGEYERVATCRISLDIDHGDGVRVLSDLVRK